MASASIAGALHSGERGVVVKIGRVIGASYRAQRKLQHEAASGISLRISAGNSQLQNDEISPLRGIKRFLNVKNRLKHLR